MKQDPLPLIVLTPKSLLRHPLVASRPRDLAEGRWMQVIDDPDAAARRRDVRRLVVCTGKIAIDLLTSPHREKTPAVAICRVEQIYPLPVRELLDAIEGYPGLEEVVWVQEEPENMGAWDFVRPRSKVSPARAGSPCSRGRAARARPKGRRRVTRRIRNGSSRTRSI